jgi:hypothetical protein
VDAGMCVTIGEYMLRSEIMGTFHYRVCI